MKQSIAKRVSYGISNEGYYIAHGYQATILKAKKQNKN